MILSAIMIKTLFSVKAQSHMAASLTTAKLKMIMQLSCSYDDMFAALTTRLLCPSYSLLLKLQDLLLLLHQNCIILLPEQHP